MRFSINIFFLLFSFSLIFSQESYNFYNLSDEPKIVINSIANVGYKNITVSIINNSNRKISINFPPGGFFNNEVDSEQDLVNLFRKKLDVSANETGTITLSTACANPKKAAPAIGRINWSYSFDHKIGILLENYHANKSIVELMTGPQNHSTSQKRHHFLQMFVWVYYNADKKHILNFATKYIFDGNKKSAEIFVDIYYPIAKLFIENYKQF
tara:strand:- start:45 stop:680 length:636 start_codon:yes stop_codon:yes gene_type:complete